MLVGERREPSLGMWTENLVLLCVPIFVCMSVSIDTDIYTGEYTKDFTDLGLKQILSYRRFQENLLWIN